MIDWQQILRAGGVRGGAMWPLRLFLGITFIWASFDKLVDPTFFNPAAPGYVGHQLAAGAASSPLGGLLTGLIVPNATLFGMLTMVGELLIGLAVLLGWYTRCSALLGLLINLMFYLTITWDVRPYYYGADIVFVVAWLTLALAGPGPLSVDAYLRRRSGAGAGAPLATRGAGAARPPAGQVAGRSTRATVAPAPAALSRRQFNVLGLGALVALALGLIDVAAWPVLHGGSKSASARLPDAGAATGGSPTAAAAADTATTAPIAQVPADTATTAPADTATAAPTAPAPADAATAAPIAPAPAVTTVPTTAAPAARPTTAPIAPVAPPTAKPVPPTAKPAPPDTPTSAPAPSGTRLAAPGQLPVGQALPFDDPNSGGPAVLVHLASGYSAYSAVCTHRGCTVGYSSSRRVLACPCHGAVFDPAANAQPIAGPALAPLASIAVTVGSDGGVYLAS